MNLRFRGLGAAWQRLSATGRWRVVFGLVAAVLAASLLVSTKPWDVPWGPTPKIRHLAAAGLWWGQAFSLAVMSILALLTPWWTRGHAIIEKPEPKKTTPPWFWPLVLLAMAVTAVMAYPRLNFGFWDDEELCARDSLIGKFRPRGEAGEAVFVPLKWEDTFFGYKTPNNHILFSILSRLSAGAVPATGDLPFVEAPYRFPAYVFGILSVGGLALFLRGMGFASAGVVAAFLLALHPWHIRYASEARGYSLILLLVPLLYLAWARALRDGNWKWWAAWGALQFALLYTYPGMLFLVAMLNALSLPLLALGHWKEGTFAVLCGRWFVSGACAAALLAPLMLPLIPQARTYFDFESERGVVLGWSWIRSALSFLLAGVPWAGAEGHVSLSDPTKHHAALVSAATATVLALLGAGTVVFARRSVLHAAIAVAIVATPVLTFFLSRLRGILLYESYILYALPGLVGLTAIGAVAVGGVLAKMSRARFVAPTFTAGLVLAYGALTHEFRQRVRAFPLQQIRESVLACRPTLAPNDPRQQAILTGSFCIPPYLYDAHMVRLDSADALIALMETADRSGRTLYLNIGMPWAAREYSPRMWKIFADDRLFEDHRTLRGFDAGLDRLVARYRPGSAATYDFGALRGTER